VNSKSTQLKYGHELVRDELLMVASQLLRKQNHIELLSKNNFGFSNTIRQNSGNTHLASEGTLGRKTAM